MSSAYFPAFKQIRELIMLAGHSGKLADIFFELERREEGEQASSQGLGHLEEARRLIDHVYDKAITSRYNKSTPLLEEDQKIVKILNDAYDTTVDLQARFFGNPGFNVPPAFRVAESERANARRAVNAAAREFRNARVRDHEVYDSRNDVFNARTNDNEVYDSQNDILNARRARERR